MPRRPVILAASWMIVFGVALWLDFPVAQWIHDSGFGQRVEGQWWAQILKEPGQFRFTVAVSLLLGILRQISRRQSLFVMLAGATSGLHVLLKWIVGRTRPYKLPGPFQPQPFVFHLFRDGLYGFFHQTNLSFPSGHVCPASALAASMFFVWPRGAWIFVVLAVIVGCERIAENAHYCSDVVGAAGFGVLGTLLLYKALSGWIEQQPTQGER